MYMLHSSSTIFTTINFQTHENRMNKLSPFHVIYGVGSTLWRIYDTTQVHHMKLPAIKKKLMINKANCKYSSSFLSQNTFFFNKSLYYQYRFFLFEYSCNVYWDTFSTTTTFHNKNLSDIIPPWDLNSHFFWDRISKNYFPIFIKRKSMESFKLI